jgi:hypothetical protein
MAQWGRRCWSDVRHIIDTRGGSRNIAAAHCHMDPPSFWRLPTRLSNNGAECPLMAHSRHDLVHRTCPLSGVKRSLLGLAEQCLLLTQNGHRRSRQQLHAQAAAPDLQACGWLSCPIVGRVCVSSLPIKLRWVINTGQRPTCRSFLVAIQGSRGCRKDCRGRAQGRPADLAASAA